MTRADGNLTVPGAIRELRERRAERQVVESVRQRVVEALELLAAGESDAACEVLADALVLIEAVVA
jgi:hypothetical protein